MTTDPNRYRVVFHADTARGHTARPGPMTCSTPSMALRFGPVFGAPVRLVVESPSNEGAEGPHTLTASYDLRGVALEECTSWAQVVDAIRAKRQRRSSADAT